MLRLVSFLLLCLALASCRKADEVVTLTFWAQCTSCRITYGMDGTVLGSDSIGGSAVATRSFAATVGQEAFMNARPLAVSNTGMGIAIRVEDHQQDFRLLRPNSAELLDSTINLRVVIPSLNRYGERQP